MTLHKNDLPVCRQDGKQMYPIKYSRKTVTRMNLCHGEEDNVFDIEMYHCHRCGKCEYYEVQ